MQVNRIFILSLITMSHVISGLPQRYRYTCIYRAVRFPNNYDADCISIYMHAEGENFNSFILNVILKQIYTVLVV